NPAGQFRIDVIVAGRDGAYRMYQLARGALLEHVSARARAEQGADITVVRMTRERQNLYLRTDFFQFLRRFQPVEVGHRYVHYQHIGEQSLGLGHSLGSVADHTGNLHVVLSIDDHFQTLAHGFVVLCEHDAELRHFIYSAPSAGNRAGTRTRMVVPSFGFDSISTAPPTSAARSRIPSRPRPLAPCARACSFGSKPTPSSSTISIT